MPGENHRVSIGQWEIISNYLLSIIGRELVRLMQGIFPVMNVYARIFRL